MQRFMLPIIVVVIISLAGCTGMSATQQSTVTGGAAGAAGGALIGAMAGNAGLGAAIGGAAGLTGGFLFGKHEESKQQAYQQGVADGRKSSSNSLPGETSTRAYRGNWLRVLQTVPTYATGWRKRLYARDFPRDTRGHGTRSAQAKLSATTPMPVPTLWQSVHRMFLTGSLGSAVAGVHHTLCEMLRCSLKLATSSISVH